MGFTRSHWKTGLTTFSLAGSTDCDPSLKAGVSGRRLLDDSHVGSSIHAAQSLRFPLRLLTMEKPPKRTRQGFQNILKEHMGTEQEMPRFLLLLPPRTEMKQSSARRVELLRCKKFSEDLGYEDGSH